MPHRQEGREIGRYFSPALCALVSVRDNGSVLTRSIGSAWTLHSRKKPEVPLTEWLKHKRETINALPTWKLAVRHLPSQDQLVQWMKSGFSKTPTGYEVEPDGIGPDGVPSWPRLLGLV